MKKYLKLLPLVLILSLVIGVLPFVSLAADNMEANILEGKTFTAADRATATHSGPYNGAAVNYDYTKLTDKDMHLHTGRFSTKSSDSTQTFDGVVDLKGGYVLGELQIYDFNPTATAAPFMGTALEIQVYFEGEWTTVVSCATNDDIIPYRVGTSYLSFNLSGTKAEKIRIYIPQRLGTNSISIYEIKCSGALYSVSNVFLGKTFEPGDRATETFVGTHSGVNVSYDYTKLTDNNTHYQTGRFSTVTAHTSQVFDGIIDLGGGYFLDELRINDFNSTDTTAPFMGTGLEIQVYSLGQWTTVVSCTSNDEIVAHRLNNVYVGFDLGGVRAEKVRIYIPARLGTNSISINEIECSAAIDYTVYDYHTNLLLGKTFVPTEEAAAVVHPDATYDYGYATITDDSYAPKGGRFSTATASSSQHVDAKVNLDGVYQLDELRIYDFNAQAEPNQSNPGYLGPNLTVEAYLNGEWTTVLYVTREEYAAHRVVPSSAWGAQYLSFDLGGVSAEMLRVYIPSNVDKNSISFYEITCSGNRVADHTNHTAKETVKENNVLPTCGSAGSYDNVTYCEVCGVEISRTTVTVDALEHNYNAVVTKPDCANGGYTTYTCTLCGYSYTGDETAALEHNYNAVVTKPDCANGGYTTYTCTACGYSYTGDETAALEHNYNAVVTKPDCANGGYTTYTCTVCGYSYTGDETAALEHNYNAVVTKPDCANGGYTTYTCTACGYSYTGDEIEALGHVLKLLPGKLATCTTAGLTEGYQCTACGKIVKYQTIIAPLGHNYGAEVTAPDCTNGGYTTFTCQLCGLSYVANKVNPLGHDYSATVSAPDCTNGGYTTFTCTVCNYSYVGKETAPLGHTEAKAHKENELAPTCTAEGKYDSVVCCTVCGVELSRQTVSVDALGHVASEAVKENEPILPSCTETLSYDSVVYCSVCGSELSRESVPVSPIGHIESIEKVTVDIVPPTCEEPGGIVEATYCMICGEYVTVENIVGKPLGHDFEEATTEAPKTCKVCGKTEGEKLPIDTEPDVDVTPDLTPEKTHDGCKANSPIEELINLVINFFRKLFGLPGKCYCGEELE